MTRKSASSVFLILGLVFITIGISTEQTAFSWVAIAFVIISLVTSRMWLRPRK